MKCAKNVDAHAKILALKSIMTETLCGNAGVFQGRSVNMYSDLRTAILGCWDDSVLVSMMESGYSCPTTCKVKQ